MSIFTNKTNWIIGFLILLNCITLGFYWFSRGPGQLPPSGKRGPIHFLSKELDLTEQQTEKLRIILQTHREKADATVKALRQERRQIIDALTEENPDTNQALELVQSVGGREAEMQLLLIEQYQSIWELCDENQQEKLRQIFKEIIPHPKGMPRPGRVKK